jgi:putative selenate reductase
MTYRTEAFAVDLPTFSVEGKTLVETGSSPFRVDQPYQIAVLTDFCNECGNCITACPTSGRPYEDKPRLYLNRAEFDAEASNAFMVQRHGEAVTVLGRFDGETHRLSVNGSVIYAAPSVVATFDESFDLVSAEPGDAASDADEISLESAAVMFALWRGLDASMPELPIASDGGTRITAPAHA